jgi:leader peptidase (prepilin peptidase)/N-methyltransferase
MLIGVLLSILFPSLQGVEGQPIIANIESGVHSIIGALIGAGLVYWIAVLGEIVFRKPAMGEGDVKFVGFIGAFCGWQGAVFAMFGGAFIGTLILLPVLLLGRIFGWKQRGGTSGSEAAEESGESVAFGSQVPFGPMLAVGGLVYFLGFDRYVDAYFADFVVSFFGQ